MSPLTEPTRLTLAKVSQPLDADAQAYVNAVEVADGQRLEDPVRFAINNFVIGCKADGIWTAIKASCILAGARTRLGALTPLVGAAPINFNFVDGDYNRKTGLVGNGSTKRLNANRDNNADPQNSNHNACYVSALGSVSQALIGVSADAAGIGANALIHGATGNLFSRNRSSTGTDSGASLTVGFAGISRSVSTSYTTRNNSVSRSVSVASENPLPGNVFLYGRGSNNASELVSSARIAFYSIGEALDLALLDARVTDLINAIGAAIP